MFKRSFRSRDRDASQQAPPVMTDSQHRIDKASRLTKRNGSFRQGDRDPQKLSKLQRSLTGEEASRVGLSTNKPLAPSPIVTLTVGREGRLFAAHEDVLCQSPYFAAMIRGPYLDVSMSGNPNRRIALPDEEPEVFSAVLEYLYKGDYYPRLVHNKQRGSWQLEDSSEPVISSPSSRRGGAGTPHASPVVTDHANPTNNYNNNTHIGGGRAGGAVGTTSTSPQVPATPAAVEATVYLSSIGHYILRDTVIYCAAERYGLGELQRLALRKQGLQAGIDVGTILRSAQYAYAHTPDSDSRLRAHYLALIIRCRRTFKRSGTMQNEMERGGDDAYGAGGGKLFFDLFVALCNHLDDVIDASNARTPKTV
jgi:hypothetical protein